MRHQPGPSKFQVPWQRRRPLLRGTNFFAPLFWGRWFLFLVGTYFGAPFRKAVMFVVLSSFSGSQAQNLCGRSQQWEPNFRNAGCSRLPPRVPTKGQWVQISSVQRGTGALSRWPPLAPAPRQPRESRRFFGRPPGRGAIFSRRTGRKPFGCYLFPAPKTLCL